MNSIKIRTFLLLAGIGLAAGPAMAHYLWIERSAGGATMYFGEYEEMARERSPGRLDEMPGPVARSIIGDMASPVPLVKQPHGFAFKGPAPRGSALVVEESGVGVKDWTRQGYGIVKPYFYARHQALDTVATPQLTLDIVPGAEPGTFKVFFRGQPLAKADVKIVAPNTWSQDGRTDENGSVRLPTPWKGQYVAQVIHLEQGAGEHEGKTYQAKRHRATLSFTLSRGAATFVPVTSKP
jgi:hypothetical protein